MSSDDPRHHRPPPMTADRVEAERAEAAAAQLEGNDVLALITAAVSRHPRSPDGTAKPLIHHDPTTWKQAVAIARRDRWAGMRTSESVASQASVLARDAIRHAIARTMRLYGDTDAFPVALVIPEDVRKAIDEYRSAKPPVAPATIRKRLLYAKQIGINTEGVRRPRPRRVLKWWLRMEDQERLISALLRSPVPPLKHKHMARLIAWTTLTGLRIEESLRLRTMHMNHKRDELTVPGTKTDGSQATITIHPFAAKIVKGYVPTPKHGKFRAEKVAIKDLMFPLSYKEARDLWQECRRILGVTDVPTATLKALRRSAARFLHVDLGMPIDLVKTYLRHRSLDTTMGYLELTGGYGLHEQARYFRKASAVRRLGR